MPDPAYGDDDLRFGGLLPDGSWYDQEGIPAEGGGDDCDQLIRQRDLEIRRLLQAKLHDKNQGRMKATFAEFDKNHNGRLSPNEFQQALLKLNLKLTPQEQEQLMNRFQRRGEEDNEISWKEFLDFVYFDEHAGEIKRLESVMRSKNEVMHGDYYARDGDMGIKHWGNQTIIELGYGPDEERLGGPLDALLLRNRRDEEASQRQRNRRHHRAYRKNNGHKQKASAKASVFEQKAPGSGHNNAVGQVPHAVWDENGRKHGAGAKMKSQALIKSAFKKIKEACRIRYQGMNYTVRDVFSQWDNDGNGMLDKEEIFEAVAALGVRLNKAQKVAVWRRFDLDNSGAIDFSEFVWAFMPRPALVKCWSTLRKTRTEHALKTMFFKYSLDHEPHRLHHAKSNRAMLAAKRKGKGKGKEKGKEADNNAAGAGESSEAGDGGGDGGGAAASQESEHIDCGTGQSFQLNKHQVRVLFNTPFSAWSPLSLSFTNLLLPTLSTHTLLCVFPLHPSFFSR
jgi:Ca2+-binding EF-hand superfamily protein